MHGHPQLAIDRPAELVTHPWGSLLWGVLVQSDLDPAHEQSLKIAAVILYMSTASRQVFSLVGEHHRPVSGCAWLAWG